MGRGNLVICGSLQQPGHHGLLRCLSLWWQQHFMVVSRSSKCHPTFLHPLLNEVRMWIGLRLTSLDADVSFVVRTGQPKTPDASRLPVLETPLIQWFMDVWWAIHGFFFHDFYSDFMGLWMDMNGIYPLVSSNMACWDTLPGFAVWGHQRVSPWISPLHFPSYGWF